MAQLWVQGLCGNSAGLSRRDNPGLDSLARRRQEARYTIEKVHWRGWWGDKGRRGLTMSDQMPNYRVGDVVNGHRWSGTTWEPVVPGWGSNPSPAVPQHQIGEVVNGYRWNGTTWDQVLPGWGANPGMGMPQYQIGQVVNGHRWNGAAWEPIAAGWAAAPPPNKPWYQAPLYIGLMIVGALVIVGLALSRGQGSPSASTQPEQPTVATDDVASATPAGDTSFVDGVLTTPEMKIVITDHKVIQPGNKGNEYGEKPVIAFWYKITNLSGGNLSPMEWIFVFTAYQDNNPNAENEIGVGSLPDSAFRDSQTEEIKEGGTVENAMAYELDDLTTPVELVASDDLGMTEIGRQTYPVS